MRKISLCFFLAFLGSIIGLSVPCKAGLPPSAVTYIYLTIDDGPLGGIRGTLGVIDQIKTPVSMMIVGAHVEASEEHKLAFQEAKKNPLVMIGNHSYSHAHDHYELFYENPEKVLEDFNKNQQILGVDWKIARLPGRNMWQVGTEHKYDIKSGQTSAQLLKKNGYTVFGWDIEWQHNSHTGEPIESVETLLNEVEKAASKSFTLGHVVILAHDEMFRSAQEDSTLLKLLKALREKGYVFRSLKDYPVD